MLQILSTSNETSTGAELVQNGNFSEIGSDLVTNGDFSDVPLGSELVTYPNFTNSDLVQWKIASSRATKSWDAAEFMRLTYDVAVGSALYATFGQTLNAYYNVKMRVRGTKADGVTAQGYAFGSIGDNGELGQVVSNPTLTSEWQDYEFNVWSTGTTFRFYLTTAAVGDLVDFDSISVKENINLVSNPNFTDGVEKIVDGDFPLPNVNWQVLPTATINGGSATIEGLGSLIATYNNWGVSQDVTGHAVGKSYKVTFTAKQLTGVGVMYGGIGYVNQFNQVVTSEYVTYTFYQTSTTSGNNWDEVAFGGVLATGAEVTNTFEIKDVSVKELGADWTVLEDTCTFGENGLTMTSTEGADLRISTNTSPLADSTSYKVIYTIHAVGLTGTNTIQYYSGDGVLSWLNLPEQGVGTHTFYYTTPSSTNNNWYFKLNLDGSTSTTDYVTISNLSVQELGEDWTIINDGTASSYFGENKVQLVTSGDFTQITQLQTIDLGASYKYSFEVVDFVSGSAVFQIGGATVVSGINEERVYSGYYTSPTGNDHFLFKREATVDLGITNITVQELDPNGYWTLVGSGLTIGEDKGIYTDAGVGSYFKNTSFVVVDGKTYRGSFDIPELTEGGLSWQTALGTVSISPNYGAADTGLTFDFVGDGSTGIKCIGTTLDNTSAITNLSVKLLGTYDDQSIYVTAADVQTIAQASVYYLVELTSMASRNSLYFLPSSVVPNNGRYTKLNFTVISKDATPTPASGIISFYDSVGGFDTYPMGFYEFRIYEQTSSTNLDPLLATGLLEKGFAFVRDFSGNMQELTDGFKEYNPTLTQYVYSK
jgi:hypothetical protein